MKIAPKELRIEYKKSSGPGGQHKNKRLTAVRITHLPTGLASVGQNERSQAQNKARALEQLEFKWEQRHKEKKKRIATHKTRRSREKILAAKKKRSRLKQGRREKFGFEE